MAAAAAAVSRHTARGHQVFFAAAAAVFACLLLLPVRVSCSDDVVQGLLCECVRVVRRFVLPLSLFFVVFFCSNGTRPQQTSRGRQHFSGLSQSNGSSGTQYISFVRPARKPGTCVVSGIFDPISRRVVFAFRNRFRQCVYFCVCVCARAATPSLLRFPFLQRTFFFLPIFQFKQIFAQPVCSECVTRKLSTVF